MKRGIQAVVKTAADEVGLQSQAEDIDPLKGVKTDSAFTAIAQGAPEDTAELQKGESMRIQSFTGGGRRTDTYTLGTSSGISTSESRSPE